MGGERAACMIN